MVPKNLTITGYLKAHATEIKHREKNGEFRSLNFIFFSSRTEKIARSGIFSLAHALTSLADAFKLLW